MIESIRLFGIIHPVLKVLSGDAPRPKPKGDSKGKNNPAEKYGKGYSRGLGPYAYLFQGHGKGEEYD